MPEITMPALSPTMEAGTLARWLKKEGDAVKPGDVLAEIETDKATMEVEAIDAGVLTRIVVPDGTEDVKVGALIAVIAGEDDGAAAAPIAAPPAAVPALPIAPPAAEAPAVAPPAPPTAAPAPLANGHAAPAAPRPDDGRILASPLARRIAELRGLDLAGLKGSGPGGRIVKADVDAAAAPVRTAAPPAPAAAAPAPASPPSPALDIPHETIKLSAMRKVIARRLTESKQTVPHYYLAIDCRLDALLALRAELNAALAGQGVKLSVNDMLIKALALALRRVPEANVSFTGEAILQYSRVDISVAVAIPAGLITPVIVDADGKRLSQIATQMQELAARAKAGKLLPHEYQGGTASLSNLGMYGIKQFEAVINPPQGMILAVGAGDRRPWVEGDAILPATVLTATGSFDHRAIDGAVGAELMAAIKALVEAPLAMLA